MERTRFHVSLIEVLVPKKVGIVVGIDADCNMNDLIMWIFLILVNLGKVVCCLIYFFLFNTIITKTYSYLFLPEMFKIGANSTGE